MLLNTGKLWYMSSGSNPGKSDLIFKDKIKVSSARKHLVLGVTIYNLVTF